MAGNNAILTEEELAAALAEVEQLSGPEAGKIPSLEPPAENAQGPAVAVLVPVPNLQPQTTPSTPVAGTSSPQEAGPAPKPAAAKSAAAKKSDATAAPAAHPPAANPAPAAPASGGSRGTLGQWVYGFCDAVLDWINRPFTRLSEGARRLIGTLGVVTLVMSLVAMMVLPLFQPDRDPFGFLNRRPAPASAPGAEHGAAPAADGHGGGH